MTLHETRPPAHPEAAVFACDAGHLAQAWVAAMQIHRLEPERQFDIVVATPEPDRIPECARASPIRFCKIDTADVPPFVHGNSRISAGTFFRHLLPSQMGSDYRALFYMDTDTWMRRTGLQGLFQRRPQGQSLAAVPTFIYDPALCARPHPVNRRAAQIFQAFPRPDGIHWQSGVQMIDTAAHIAARIGPRIFDYVRSHHGLLAEVRLGDQGALNGILGTEVALLDPRWNWHHERWMTPALLARFDPHILHFIGKAKPWQVQDDPLIAAWHRPWAEGLRAWDPAWEPETLAGSAGWLARHPVTGVPPLDAVHRAAVRLLARRRAGGPRVPEQGIRAMADLIDRAEVR